MIDFKELRNVVNGSLLENEPMSKHTSYGIGGPALAYITPQDRKDLSSILKFTFYFLINNKIKKKIYFNRASGFVNAILGKPSWYRPNLED